MERNPNRLKIIIALDGDLLVPSGREQDIDEQINAIGRITKQLSRLVKDGHKLVITHGNAPQVGYMLLRGEAAKHIVHGLPLDICGADTQGATGYMLQQALRNWLDQEGCEREVVTLITQVLAEEIVPNSVPHTKGIGPYFNQNRAVELTTNRGWDLSIVPGQGYQRVVPCLTPMRILEINSIRTLFNQNVVVVCTGGGGIPITIDKFGNYKGVEAVVDKAYSAFLLAEELDSDLVVFVSPLERIIQFFEIDPQQRSQIFEYQLDDKLFEKSRKKDDTTQQKLVASHIYLQNHNKVVLIVTPDELGLVTNGCAGIRIKAPADKILEKNKKLKQNYI